MTEQNLITTASTAPDAGAAQSPGVQESQAQESQAQESQPQESQAQESQAQESQAQESQSQQTQAPAPIETQGVDVPAPGQPSVPALPAWGWAGIAVAAALLAAVAVAALRRKRPPISHHRGCIGYPPQDPPIGGNAEAKPPTKSMYTVQKLHEQGARKSQQDSFYVSPVDGDGAKRLLAVVADGMGGLSEGDKVSQAAVTAMANGFYAAQGQGQELLLELLAQANRAVNVLLGPDGLCSGGSTLVAGLIQDDVFHYLSVGDSRICLLRNGDLYQLNREHIYRNELCVDAANGACAPADAGKHPKAGGLTSFLGMGQLKYVDLPAQPIAVQPGDLFVLMTDGVYNALTHEELRDALAAVRPADALRTAIQAKNYANQDNYTAVLIHCIYAQFKTITMVM